MMWLSADAHAAISIVIGLFAGGILMLRNIARKVEADKRAKRARDIQRHFREMYKRDAELGRAAMLLAIAVDKPKRKNDEIVYLEEFEESPYSYTQE